MLLLLSLLTQPIQAAAGDNVVLLMTDDQRWDTLWAMPWVQGELAARGRVFEDAWATTPLCCPFRSSLLSGGFYAHNTGVLTNEPPNGGAPAFWTGDTLAVRLQEQGYATALFGKYLNRYEDIAPEVPPGWTEWASNAGPFDWYDYTLIEGSSGAEAAQGAEVAHTTYIAEHLEDRALAFIDDHLDQPFFLFVSFHAPHTPSTPAREDAGSFDDYTWRGRGYDEDDVSDKPIWIQDLPPLDAEAQAALDQSIRDQLASLQAVDRAIERIWTRLDRAGLSERTLVIFTSDNGMLWGEHRLQDKGAPYDESARVPLIMSHPEITPGTEDRLVGVNIDLGPTVAALLEIPWTADGRDLSPLFDGTDGGDGWRESLLIEAWDTRQRSWAGVVTDDWKYVAYGPGDEELYDRAGDPYELENLAYDPARAETLDALRGALAAERGLVATDRTLGGGQVGAPYDDAVSATGGAPPHRWSVVDGALPDGLTLSEGGALTGAPEAAGTWAFSLQVEDSSASPYHGGPQRHVVSFELTVDPADDGGCGCRRIAAGETGAGGALVFLLWGYRRRSKISTQP